MYSIVSSHRFSRSLKKIQTSGTFSTSAASNFELIVICLKRGQAVLTTRRDHALASDMSAYRECHIKGDLLLVYRRFDSELIIELVDIGTHAQIFG
ncbi:hypothetical protein A2673_01260 [Candidatus Kaiserbacteria bacterium RIFCSPHIGHO2_01_FULL_50_13]|uniref:Addiction module toxin RelE n=1 Tax=Candidatus Kaiserbacteria bacterium RIFCSPLOWO2_01_FULL_50_24 TaxID=1798507 RepID=A0A1F6ENA5_9BACT|nr:MAG: hypothetical protein A2673_01260 [Candidatus Kaiserbacteria bacterium RIFCSPHIGHO2_01_FULL_50_13]OGG75128.1 MAG: hypothetical protein A3A34_02110 [Candidatus Kaiserbacteria bacterium RIFCSPLOWO2_01_FULL_50_24]OGG82220.1 MAG: hypothetical protein A3H74_02550 [Candidatus Kaiserbacteria bacterium RIFCSPLOWO2_02_FULL_51_13]